MKKKNVFWGLLFILAAVLIILDQFGIFLSDSMFEIVISVFLAGIAIKSLRYLNFWGVMMPIAFICIIFAEEWNITEFTPGPALLTASLLSIGLSLLFKRNHYHKQRRHPNEGNCHTNIEHGQDEYRVECYTSFGESIKYVNSNNFEQADVRCSFGQVKVYFDKALIPSGKAVINLKVSFGDAVLYMPRTWKIIDEVSVLFGEVDKRYMNNYNETDEVCPVVTLRGSVNFGDIRIIYV